MKRFTTPMHTFAVPIDPREWDEYRITYSQAGSIVLEKTEQDAISVEEKDMGSRKIYYLRFKLTQEETSLFRPKLRVEIQIRCHYPNGSVFASNIVTVNVDDVLNQEILGDEDSD